MTNGLFLDCLATRHPFMRLGAVFFCRPVTGPGASSAAKLTVIVSRMTTTPTHTGTDALRQRFTMPSHSAPAHSGSCLWQVHSRRERPYRRSPAPAARPLLHCGY